MSNETKGKETKSDETKEMTTIYKKLTDVEKYMQDRVGLGVSFDLGVRKISVLHHEVNVYYVNGLVDSVIISNLLEQLLFLNDEERVQQSGDFFKIIENQLVHHQVKPLEKMDELVDQVLSGLIVAVMEGYNQGLAIDVRSYPGRTPQEPDT